MKKSAIIIILIACVFVSASAELSSASSKEEHASWWIETYRALEGKDHPLVPRVHKVFEKVRNAADKRGAYFPKLVILQYAKGNLALCIEDGTVLLTRKAIDICYAGKNREIGDARVAFVLGHELAHLANGDFWYREASENIRRFGPGKAAGGMRIVIDPADMRRKRELKADADGLLYASMSGYDPKVIVNTEGANFFQEWERHIAGKFRSSDGVHPPAGLRGGVLLANMKAVIEELYFFDISVRLYQLGMYKDALIFLEKFRAKFPCREVLSNIGLVRCQMAMNKLAECDPDAAFRFRLPAVLDTETRAREYMRDRPGEDCAKDMLKHALRYLRDACEKDVFYVPARVNYSSALIMAGEYSRAMAVAEEALKLEKDEPNALNNLAIAMYLLGPSPYIKVDMFKNAADMLKGVIKTHPDFPDAYYNLGRIQAERGRNSAVGETWRKYLEIEPAGLYADIVRKSLDMEAKSKSAPLFFHEVSPVKLGRFDSKTEKQLKGFDRRKPKLGAVHCEYYSKNGIRVLALGDVVEVVERIVRGRMRLAEMRSRYGKAHKIFRSLSGVETLMYGKFAVDVREGMVTRVIYFEKKRI